MNWEHLPEGYREHLLPLFGKYGIAARKGKEKQQFELGKKKGDISVLMALVSCDKFLKHKGRLGFVITQSVFKTGASSGFRRFCLEDYGEPLRVVHVDDMVALNPFEGASNRTAVMVLEKGKPNRYPVPYTVWRKKGRGRFTYDSSLEEVISATRTLRFAAEPVDPEDPTSPWLTATKPALRAVRKVLGKSDYTAHAGVYTGGANAVYWVEIVAKRPDGLVVVRNITKGAKRKVPEVTEVIEPDLLYPLLRGRDVQRWYAKPSAHIVVPHTKDTGWQAIDEKELQGRYPLTFVYFNRFKEILLSRVAYNLLRQGHPFYILKDISDYTFAPWKVVWREQASQMTAALAGLHNGKPIVPDHKLMLVDCDSSEEAHYICAALNSDVTRFGVMAYAVGIQMDPHILEHIAIHKYDLTDPVHRALAEASKEAHEAAARGDEAHLREIEDKVDALAAKLWGLTDKELKEIESDLEGH